MIDYISMLDFCSILNKYKYYLVEWYNRDTVYNSFLSGAKLEICLDGFILQTKNGVSHEFEYSDCLSVALEVQCENVFITVYHCIEENIYENVFNCMIYERYP